MPTDQQRLDHASTHLHEIAHHCRHMRLTEGMRPADMFRGSYSDNDDIVVSLMMDSLHTQIDALGWVIGEAARRRKLRFDVPSSRQPVLRAEPAPAEFGRDYREPRPVVEVDRGETPAVAEAALGIMAETEIEDDDAA